MQDETVKDIIILADILEKCDFELFWERADKTPERFKQINGFFDSIRKYVSHVVGITYQTIDKDLLKRIFGRIDGEFVFFSLDFRFTPWYKNHGFFIRVYSMIQRTRR